ncbi:MAG: glutamate carboxypeptidase, partial [Ilumatobacter sp.]
MTVFDLDAMIADTRTLIEIESPSGDLPQLQKSAIALASMIERYIGGKCELVDSPKGPHVHWKGGDETTVMLLGHHDTVFPMGTLERLPF